MKSFLSSRLVQGVCNGLAHRVAAGISAGVSVLQHLCMKAAVAISLKLCMFTARVLLGAAEQNRSEQFQGNVSHRMGESF
ncbi:MAG: hypothetical protein AAF528_11545 [Cyanobacteria bacterium P01_C01_bin.121]